MKSKTIRIPGPLVAVVEQMKVEYDLQKIQERIQRLQPSNDEAKSA